MAESLPRQGSTTGRNTWVPADEFEKWAKFVSTHDSRLPEQPTTIDVLRSLYKIAVREARTGRSTDSGPVPDGTVHDEDSPSVSSESSPGTAEGADFAAPASEPLSNQGFLATGYRAPALPRRREISTVHVEKLIELEKQKANTFYWKARAAGRAVARETTVSSKPLGFLCKLHQTVHQDGPCPEIQQISHDLNLPVDLVGRHGEGG